MPTTQQSDALFEEAQNYIPGGVNSPVRAFRAVGGHPRFIQKAKGAYVWDADDNRYIELINSWGPMILGHANPDVEAAVIEAIKHSPSFGAPTAAEVEIAKLITDIVPSVEKVRMVNSGTEATMSAVRLARGYTKRDKFIKISGCYHGHGDSFLIAAGSGAITFGVPNSPGVTEGTAKDTLLAPYNDLEKVDELLAQYPEQIAALIIEPVPGNMGCILPNEGYLEGLRERCTAHGVLLIFDEVMTGFRLSLGGAQEFFGVRPDLSTFGKIIGGGMPVGAYGGKAEIMDYVSPVGPVYQAGTLSGNPVAMAAGLVMLKALRDDQTVYERLTEKCQKITQGIQGVLDELKLNFTMNQVGSMYSLFFSDKKITNFEEAQGCDTEAFGRFFQGMLAEGVYLAPSQFESLFLSDALTDEDIAHIIEAHRKVLTEMYG